MRSSRIDCRHGTSPSPRVGLFGLLGAGNLGNDASMQSVLDYLREAHPEAVVDAMCTGPERLTGQYGIEAVPLSWRPARHDRGQQGAVGRGSARARLTGIAWNVLGKGVDALRTASWVRGHDVIIVPGMGVLEASLPLRPWETPYAMFLLCASARIFGRKVALVSVGANPINQRVSRWLFDSAAKLACYRSYRDAFSRDAMRQRGIDTAADRVYPDLVCAIAPLAETPGDPNIVGIGVMTYYGTNDDRRRAADIHLAYVESLKRFSRWLLDSGRRVRLFVGDTVDHMTAEEVLADLRAYRPDLDSSWAIADEISSFSDLMRAMAPVGAVVATRFHNVMCALKLGKPTISIGYSQKNVALMEEMGLGEFCQSANSLDVDRLINQFKLLEDRAPQLRKVIAERHRASVQRLDHQFSELSSVLFPRRDG